MVYVDIRSDFVPAKSMKKLKNYAVKHNVWGFHTKKLAWIYHKHFVWQLEFFLSEKVLYLYAYESIAFSYE